MSNQIPEQGGALCSDSPAWVWVSLGVEREFVAPAWSSGRGRVWFDKVNSSFLNKWQGKARQVAVSKPRYHGEVRDCLAATSTFSGKAVCVAGNTAKNVAAYYVADVLGGTATAVQGWEVQGRQFHSGFNSLWPTSGPITGFS